MATTTTQLNLYKPGDAEFGWQQMQRDNSDKIDTEAARVAAKLDPQHHANGTHSNVTADSVSAPSMTLGGVQRGTWPTPGSASVALTDVLTNGSSGNIPAAQEFAVNNSAGTIKHFAVDEATGKVTAINLSGMLGNISDPLVHIPFRRANDEVRLSGTQTFSRASTGTYFDTLDGLLKTAAIDTPRFERMADGGIGYLTEGASTNLLTYSEQFDNAAWTKSGTSVSPGSFSPSPDGTSSADALVDGSTSGTHSIGESYSFVSGTTYTFSVFVRQGTLTETQIVLGSAAFGSAANVIVDLTTGTATATGASATVKIKSLINSWYRIEVTATATATVAANVLIFLMKNGAANYVGDGLGKIHIFGAQLEALPFATSYIPTTTAAVTRAADILTLPASGNVPMQDFSLMLDMDLLGHNSNNWQRAVSLTGDIRWLLYEHKANNAWAASFDLVGSSNSNIAADPAAGVARIGALSSAGQGYSISNGALGNAVTVTRGTPTQIVLSEAGYPLYGHMRNFRIYDKALTASEIAAA